MKKQYKEDLNYYKMKKQIKNNQLKSFIHIESGIIPKDTCKFVIDTIKNSLWSKHTWGDDKDKNNTYSYSTKELDVLPITKDLEDIFKTLKLDVRIIGEDYKGKDFTAKQICLDRSIVLYYNERKHNFSSTELKKRINNGKN